MAWGENKQTVVALSTCAAEYISLLEGAQNLVLSQSIMLEDIKHTIKMKIFCDNEKAILIAGAWTKGIKFALLGGGGGG